MADRAKPTLPPQVEWDDRFRGWASKFIAKNKWRCDPLDDFNDLMNDAYLVFRYVRASYPLITEPKHLMSLFQRAMINEFHDKSKERSKRVSAEISFETLVGEDLTLIETLGENNNEGYLRLLLNELPVEVRMALDAFHDDEKLAQLRQPKPLSKLAKLAGIEPIELTFNEMLCRIIGLPKTIDLVSMIRSALSPN